MFHFLLKVLAFYELVNLMRKVRESKEADDNPPPKEDEP